MPLKAAIVPVTPLQQNCAILWDPETKRGAVIDPGGDAEWVADRIAEHEVQVEHILLTHGHIDHAGGAALLKRLLGGVPIVGPGIADKFLLDELPQSGLRFGIPDAEAVTPDRWLEEGETLPIAGRDFAVFHCPGHTPGHMVFVDVPGKVAIVGDVLFQGSIGRTDFPYGDGPALVKAIRTKLFPLGDDIAFLCGHGPGSSFGAERRANPFVGDRAGPLP
ncbi:MBL fold metallo-hydrolase [Elioraea rosea]|uniref:MBL fold metallo-hydrolase n=1 Tax=Elioraea rosea TaxID=2492390 RepID=UPI001184B9FA|nr:MBL fold metallo-hydrolase [Elioraea rosea]